MQIHRAILTLAFAVLCVGRVVADPENFLVGPFTLTRPADWTWKDLPDKSKASALLSISDKKTGEAQILISWSRSSREAVAATWKGYFDELRLDRPNVTSKVKGFPVTYVVTEGTLRATKTSKPNQALLGVIVETKRGNVCGRMIGPKALVEKSGDQLKKMIEDALKQE